MFAWYLSSPLTPIISVPSSAGFPNLQGERVSGDLQFRLSFLMLSVCVSPSVPFTILWRHSHTLAVSNSRGVINVNREAIPPRNVKYEHCYTNKLYTHSSPQHYGKFASGEGGPVSGLSPPGAPAGLGSETCCLDCSAGAGVTLSQ